jgi:predicted transcriptional regulator
MKKFLAALVIGATFLVPTHIMLSSPQIAFAQSRVGEEADTFTFQIMGRIRALQMQMEKLETMLMENKGKMTKAKMEKMEKMLNRLEKEIQELLQIGSGG